jgi:sphingomyelin phosphodiesterase acid-like 3
MSFIACKPTGLFWHLADIHLDPDYVQGGDPLQPQGENCHYLQKDPKGPKAGPYGDFSCDAPITLVKSALNFMQTIPTDFILYTGDSAPHDIYTMVNRSFIENSNKNIANLLLKAFPNMEVFPSIGNHDVFPVDNAKPGPYWLYTDLALLWKHWLNSESLKTFLKGGYYSQLTRSNRSLRIVSLNTILWLSENVNATNYGSDPADQFNWLQETLHYSRKNSEKVYIIGHSPPGGYEQSIKYMNLWDIYNEQLLNIISQYSDVITGLIFGHTHIDSFRLLKSNTSENFQVVLNIAPSLTPWRNGWTNDTGNNPGLRLFKYNATDSTIINHYQFFANLTKANLLGRIDWKMEYDAVRAYGLKDYSVASWSKLLNLFSKEINGEIQSALFEKYVEYTKVSEHFDCDKICRFKIYCAIANLTTTGIVKCNQRK